MTTCQKCLHVAVCGKLIWNEKDGTIICGDFKARFEHVKQQVHAHWIINGDWGECSNCYEGEKIAVLVHKDY